MLSTVVVMNMLVFTLGGEIIETFGPIPEAFCNRLRKGLELKIITEADPIYIDTTTWSIECKVTV